uniref:Helicase-associated domain-containing protein n=1 Tax=Anopheles albimanus TaxID=7167 RepID=A0A182F6C1_ANOAL
MEVKLEIHRVDNGGCLEFGTKTESLLGPKQCEQKRRVNERFVRNETAFHFCNIKHWLENTSQAAGIVPPASGEDEATALQRAQLPIACCRNDILDWLASADPVAIITGAVDVNRGVQTVQYILEDCSAGDKACRALCVQSTEQEVLIIVKQVCQERKESIGKTVGYDVTFSHLLNDDITNVVICSTQTLLAHLMAPSGEKFFRMLTHLIVDDVGQRTFENDLLLHLLKEKISKHKSLKLLLLSSKHQAEDANRVFNHAPNFAVPEYKHIIARQSCDQLAIRDIYLATILTKFSTNTVIQNMKSVIQDISALEKVANFEPQLQYQYLDSNVRNHLDILLKHCWLSKSEDSFEELMQFYQLNPFMVDYLASETKMSALMIAAHHGHIAIVEFLLALGANPYLKGKGQLEVVHWCFSQADAECLSMIDRHYDQYRSHPAEWRYEQALLWMYQRLHNPYAVDYQLVANIVLYIYENIPAGPILIIMPEFTDIMACYDLLRRTPKMNLPPNSFVVLHRFVADDEIASEVEHIGAVAFQIILLEDCMLGAMPKIGTVDYVIDTGLTDCRSYNTTDGSCKPHFKQLITKEMAKVRSAIAQRTCFHLYSMQQELWCMEEKEQKSRNYPPMAELLLKFVVCRPSASGVSFLERALAGTLDLKVPGFLEHLQQIGAICIRDLAPTNLGLLLANLCNSAALGKALLYAIMFRCIDPVLTIVASLLVGDPFIEPRNETERKRIACVKASFDRRSLSDFYVLLRLYQEWNVAKVALNDGSMVDQHCLKLGAMEAISNLRTRLMSHLRALDIVTVGRSVNVHQLNERSSQWSTIKGCLAAGLYPNLVKMNYETLSLVSCSDPDPLELHPASVVKVKELASHWITYVYKQDSRPPLPKGCKRGNLPAELYRKKLQIVENTVISDWTVALMCGVDQVTAVKPKMVPNSSIAMEHTNELIIGQRCVFKIPRQYVVAVGRLREGLARAFREFTEHPLQALASSDSYALLGRISTILQLEEVCRAAPNTATKPKILKKCWLGTHWVINHKESRETRTNP